MLIELDYNVMAHAQKTIIVYGEIEQVHILLTADMIGRHFNSLLAAGFCVGMARNMLTHSGVMIPLRYPSFAHVCAIT
jgi:hypothetical protein